MDLNRITQHMTFDSEKQGVAEGLHCSRQIREQSGNPNTSENQPVQIQDHRVVFLFPKCGLV